MELSKETIKELSDFIESNKEGKALHIGGVIIPHYVLKVSVEYCMDKLKNHVANELRKSVEFREKCYEKAVRTPIVVTPEIPYKDFITIARELEQYLSTEK